MDLDHPPNVLSFDRLPTKKPRTSKTDPSTQGSSTTIHNHLPGAAAPVLTDDGGQQLANTHANIITKPSQHEDSDDDFVPAYATIQQALQELHAVMPNSNFPQYRAALITLGAHYVDGAAVLTAANLRNDVGMPTGVIDAFQCHVRRLVKRAKKGKGCVLVVKDEGDEENRPFAIN